MRHRILFFPTIPIETLTLKAKKSFVRWLRIVWLTFTLSRPVYDNKKPHTLGNFELKLGPTSGFLWNKYQTAERVGRWWGTYDKNWGKYAVLFVRDRWKEANKHTTPTHTHTHIQAYNTNTHTHQRTTPTHTHTKHTPRSAEKGRKLQIFITSFSFIVWLSISLLLYPCKKNRVKFAVSDRIL